MHEYEDGLLIRSVTTREPLYTEQDRAELLALALHREGLCPLCGRSLAVCTAPEPETGPQFNVSWQVCGATRALVEKQRATYDSGTYPNRAAHLWGTTNRKR